MDKLTYNSIGKKSPQWEIQASSKIVKMLGSEHWDSGFSYHVASWHVGRKRGGNCNMKLQKQKKKKIMKIKN